MKKLLSKLALFAAVLFAAASCGEVPPGVDGPIDNSGPLFKITATTSDYSRATDTAFEVGDAISVFASKGSVVLPEGATAQEMMDALANLSVWIDNGKFTKGESGFSGDKEYKWYEGEEKSQIFAFYPYNEKWATTDVLLHGVNFCVQTDQTTHKGYTASDLMFASLTDVAPTEESVQLTFGHLLSKIVVDVKNERTDKVVAAYVDGVQGNYLFEFPQYSATGDRGTIRAGELATPTEGYTNSFVLIVPPQKVAPKLAFVTDAGEQLTFENTEAEVEFGAGKVRHLTVTITSKSISAEFDAIVNDWSADPDVEFKDQPGQGGSGDDDQPGEGGGDDQPGEGGGDQQTINAVVCGSDGSQSDAFRFVEGTTYEVSLLVEDTAVGYSLMTTPSEGDAINYGGTLISTIFPVEMKEGSEERVFFPFTGAYKLKLNAADMTLDITPWITMGGQFSYLGQGQINEGGLFGVIWDVDVMSDKNGSYLYVTPFGDLLKYVAEGNMPNLKLSESVAPPAYVLVSTAIGAYNGVQYTSVSASSPTSRTIYPGLMYDYNGEWYDIELQSSNVTSPVPYNRMVGEGLLQTAPLYTLAGLGSFPGTNSSNGMITYILPGASMDNASYNLVGIEYAGLHEESGECVFNIYIERDAQTFAIIPIANEISEEEVSGLIDANLGNAMIYNYTHSKENADEWASVAWTPEQTGRYGMIVLGISNGNLVVSRNFCNYSYTKPGESGFPCEVTFTAEKDSLRPEDQIVVKMKGTNITSANYSCLPNKAEYASLTDSELQAECEAHGYNYLTGYLDYVNDMGYSEVFTKLQPSTEYLVVGWFANDFGNTKMVRCTVTTDAAAQWTSLGIGRYQDASHFFSQTEATRSAVEILQDSDGSAHYRIVKPYAGYWSRYSEGYIGHCGDYLELAVYDLADGKGGTTRHICFDPHSTGLQIGGEEIIIEHAYNGATSSLKYPMRDKPETVEVYMKSPNRAITDNVFQLAPWYMVKDTNRGYNYSATEGAILIVLPWEGSDQISGEEIAPASRATVPAPLRVAPSTMPTNEGGVVVKGGTRSRLARGRKGEMRLLPTAEREFTLQ